MVRYLLTGAAGFIGSHVAEALLARGDEVVGVDNFNDYYSPARKRRNVMALLAQPGFRLVEADFRDRAVMEQLFAAYAPEKVAHLGAMAGVRYSLQHPALYVDVNVVGTQILLDLAQRYGARAFVLASTSSVYGKSAPVPFRESEGADQPLSPYAATKRAAEILAYTYHHLYGLPVYVTRLFTVYGPRGRPDMTPLMFMERIVRGQPITLFDGGEQLQRDFTYISDIVSGIVQSLDRATGYEIVNLGNNHPVQMRAFVSIMERVTGRVAQIDVRPTPATEPPITCADISKARRLLGYEPRVGIEAGLAHLWHWYQREEMGQA